MSENTQSNKEQFLCQKCGKENKDKICYNCKNPLQLEMADSSFSRFLFLDTTVLTDEYQRNKGIQYHNKKCLQLAKVIERNAPVNVIITDVDRNIYSSAFYAQALARAGVDMRVCACAPVSPNAPIGQEVETWLNTFEEKFPEHPYSYVIINPYGPNQFFIHQAERIVHVNTDRGIGFFSVRKANKILEEQETFDEDNSSD